MKKILCLTSLTVVFLLAACGGGSTDETVCTIEDNLFGGTMVATLGSNDNEITSVTIEVIWDITDMSDEQIQEIIDFEIGDDDDIDYNIDGDELTISQTVEGEDVEAEGFTRNLEEMVSELERNGATCN